MNWDRLLDALRLVRAVLDDAEAGGCDAECLLGPLHRLTGATCGRAGEFGGRAWSDWCDLGHALRDGLRFAVETGRRLPQELARVRRLLAPLLAVLDAAGEIDGGSFACEPEPELQECPA